MKRQQFLAMVVGVIVAPFIPRKRWYLNGKPYHFHAGNTTWVYYDNPPERKLRRIVNRRLVSTGIQELL